MQETKKSFNHYKLHTQYSICEGAIKIEDLEKFCKNNKINSIGISDTSNLCGALQFSESVSKFFAIALFFHTSFTSSRRHITQLSHRLHKRQVLVTRLSPSLKDLPNSQTPVRTVVPLIES